MAEVKVRLDYNEVALCYHIASIRNLDCMRLGKKHRRELTKPAEGMTNHLFGVLGEKVVAKWAGLHFFVPSVESFELRPDLGEIDVRTAPPGKDRLLIRERDADDKIVVAVQALDFEGWEFVISGWAKAIDVKRNGEALSGLPKAYVVDAATLHPADDALRNKILSLRGKIVAQSKDDMERLRRLTNVDINEPLRKAVGLLLLES